MVGLLFYELQIVGKLELENREKRRYADTRYDECGHEKGYPNVLFESLAHVV